MEIIWILIILQAIICGGFCAYISSQKNRSIASWFWLGLLFGIFALIAVAAVPRLSVEERKEFSTGEIQCPHCGAANRSSANKCFSCKKNL